MNINETIVEFAKREREEAEKAKENERNMASIDPESYIAKEIKYQTALLHAISEEIYQLKKAMHRCYHNIDTASCKRSASYEN